MKFISFLVIVFTALACSSDPIIISGKIVDKTGIPILRAEIRTLPATDIVSTDENGFFYLTRRLNAQPPEIQPGQYTILVKKEGYKTLEFNVFAEKGDVWTNRRQMQNEDALVNPIAPGEGGEDEPVDAVSTPIMGL